MKIFAFHPGDTVRVNLPEYKGRFFKVLSIYCGLIEIAIGEFVEMEVCTKKYKNRYITIPTNEQSNSYRANL